MKIIPRSLIGAAALFGMYTVTTLAVGYIKTRNYEPDFDAAWANAENLPNEVAFGQAPSPYMYIGIFGGLVLGCAVVLIVYDRFSSNGPSSKKLSR